MSEYLYSLPLKLLMFPCPCKILLPRVTNALAALTYIELNRSCYDFINFYSFTFKN